MPPKAMFKGHVFAISGALSQPRKDYEELIQKYGGEVSSSLTKAVTFLVTTPVDVKACTQKVATARGRNVPMVHEGFVGACVTAKKLLDPEFFAVEAPTGAKRKNSADAASSSATSSASVPVPAATSAPSKTATGSTKRVKLVVTTDAVAVIAKSGLADKAAVLKEDVSKGFMKASLTWDVELVLSDPVNGKDKFYCMQLLAGTSTGNEAQEFWAIQHWGRTGCEGRVHVDGPFTDVNIAKKVFRQKFRSKTGNVWGNIGGTFVDVPGKHKILQKVSSPVAMGLWQYYMHNSINGKAIGWYDYEEDPAKAMEKHYQTNTANTGLEVRYITTGYFVYEVDFTNMTQTNTKSGTRRAIRRVPPGEAPSSAPPSVIPEAASPKPEVAAAAAAESSAEEDEEAGGGEEEEEHEGGAEKEEEADDDDATVAAEELEGGAEERADDDDATQPAEEADDAETLVMGGTASRETLS